MLDQGFYAGIKKSIGMDTSKSGTALIDIVFTVTLHSVGGKWVPIDPVEKHVRIYLSEAAWASSQQKLDHIGFNGDFTTPDITSEWVNLECQHQMYENKKQEKIELSGWGTQRERVVPNNDALRKLTARYQSDSANSKQPETKPPETPTSTLPPTAEDEAAGVAEAEATQAAADAAKAEQRAAVDRDIPF